MIALELVNIPDLLWSRKKRTFQSRRNLALTSDDDAREEFRFTINEMEKILRLLQLPEVLDIRSGLKINRLEALAILLCRLSATRTNFDIGSYVIETT